MLGNRETTSNDIKILLSPMLLLFICFLKSIESFMLYLESVVKLFKILIIYLLKLSGAFTDEQIGLSGEFSLWRIQTSQKYYI